MINLIFWRNPLILNKVLNKMLNKIICIIGPTVSGKTDLAIKLVKKFSFDIISVDSAMIYSGMNVGTAKPSVQELTAAPHRLINIRDPGQAYSAGDFLRDAEREITAIYKENKIPLLVGGTMLYFRALQFGMAELPSANSEIRESLAKELKEFGIVKLHERLAKIDPIAANRIHRNDQQRLLRALEVYEQTGQTISELQFNTKPRHKYQFTNIGLIPGNRSLLHERIEMRFKKMIADGFIEEVKKLKSRGDLDINMPSMRAVGYRQIWEYLEGKLTFDEMIECGIIATRQLAKRQLTWLRSWPDLNQFDCDDEKLFTNVTKILDR